ncbi:hypothetical protein Lacidipiscis_00304 [Ligilactobacillus acidipiscis]|nr:hypothetical protein Lacidipiscis_00304 [Ligilactobacillus acidipiscis]
MDLGIMASAFLVVMSKLIRRSFLGHVARLKKQGGVNRLKVEHYRTSTISRVFYDLLLKLDRRRLLIHVARLLKQSRENSTNMN